MIRSVLVPLDGSSFGEHALPLASKIARRAGASLHLARVHQSLPPPFAVGAGFVDEVDLALKSRENASLQDAARRLDCESSRRLTTELLVGEVATALSARAADTDLVVMSTHGRGPLGRFWLGSVADQLIRVLPVPVLLVRPRESLPDFSREPACKRMLLPLDGTPLAEQIIEPALEVGTLLGSSFTLVRVVKPALVGDYVPEGGTFAGMTDSLLDRLSELQRGVEREARSYLEAVAGRLAGRGLSVQTRVLVEEQPAAGILREAETDADVIALATHGRRGLPRLLLGSVADKLVRGCTLPVLLYRPRTTDKIA